MFIDPHEKQAKLPAWITSMVVHGCLVLLLLFWVSRLPQGSAEETSRDVGIVLKRQTADGVKFEGEDDTPTDQTADINTPNPTPSEVSDVLPSIDESSNSADALPTLPALGPQAESGGSAAAMTEAGGTRGGRPGEVGKAAEVAFFGVKGTGTKFVYLVDRSSSMEGAPLAAAKQQIAQSLSSLDSVHQFQIIFFNTRAQPFSIDGRQRIAFATEQNIRMAGRLLAGVTDDGGTDRLTALLAALRLGPDVVFFLTDADGPMSEIDMREVQQLNRRVNAMISTVEFGRGPDPGRFNFLKALAERTGGQYGYVNTSALGE